MATLPACVSPRSSHETIRSLASAAYPSRSASVVIGGSAYASGRRGRASLASAPMRVLRSVHGVHGWRVAPRWPWSSRRRPGRVLGRRIRRGVVEHDHRARRPRATTTTIPGGSDTCPGFHGSTTSLTSTGPTAPAFLIDATAGAQGCLDVVTFTFQTRGDGTPPGYTVGYQDQTKRPVPGRRSADRHRGAGHRDTWRCRIAPAASTDPSVPDSPRQTYTGNLSLEYGDHHHLQIVRELPDGKDAAGQDTVNWVIGLDSLRPFRVDRCADARPGTAVTILIGCRASSGERASSTAALRSCRGRCRRTRASDASSS